LPSTISFSLPNHHTFSFPRLGLSFFPCAKNHSHLPLFPQVFFFHGFFPSTIAFFLLPNLFPLYYCSSPFVKYFSLLPLFFPLYHFFLSPLTITLSLPLD
jgi:hypothetical protein